jgi:hypothetical protein
VHTTPCPGLYYTFARSGRQEHRTPARSYPPLHTRTGDSDDATAESKTYRIFLCKVSRASMHVLQAASRVGYVSPQHPNAGCLMPDPHGGVAASAPQLLLSTRSLRSYARTQGHLKRRQIAIAHLPQFCIRSKHETTQLVRAPTAPTSVSSLPLCRCSPACILPPSLRGSR